MFLKGCELNTHWPVEPLLLLRFPSDEQGLLFYLIYLTCAELPFACQQGCHLIAGDVWKYLEADQGNVVNFGRLVCLTLYNHIK
jgi:hypothetical protein